MATRKVTSPAAALSRTEQPVNVATGDGLENLVAGLGTSRDKRAHTTYTSGWSLDRLTLESMYRTSWLAKRIINTVADDMTREGWSVAFEGKEEDKDKRDALERAEVKFQIRDKVNSALRWARLYGGCAIVIGIKGANLETPLVADSVVKGSLRYLHVMDRHRLSPSSTLTIDMDSANFGKPEYFTVAESSVRVHHSRMAIFDGEELPYFIWRSNSMWHDSVLQHAYSALMDADASTANIASMMFEANVDVVTSDGLQNMLATKAGEELVTKRYQLAGTLKGINRLLLLDGKETYEKKGNNFSNLDKVLDKFMDMVCGATEIPRSRLFGQSAGGLNATGEGDEGVYYDSIKAKQEADAKPQLNYLYEILARSELGEMPEDFELSFNPLSQMSEKEQAEVDKLRAETDQIYFDMGVLHEGQIGKALKERGTYAMSDEDLDMLAELAAEPPPAPPGVDPLTGLPLPPPPAPGVKPAPKPGAPEDKTDPDQPVAGVEQE